ncbi:hypothetical protein ACR9E3_17915 [Actinomycetospora sp. C-140]
MSLTGAPARHQTLWPTVAHRPHVHRRPAPPVHATTARAAAVLTPLGVALALASTVVDPPSREPEPRGMYVAYGADPTAVDAAATLLHQGALLLGVGLLLAGLALVSGRGRVLAGVGGALAALGFLDLSGSVAEDWFDAHLAAVLGPDRAMVLGQQALDAPGYTLGWMLPMLVGTTLGPWVLAIGLARSGLLGWWTVALPVLATVAFAASDALGTAGFPIVLAVHGVFGVILARALWRAP